MRINEVAGSTTISIPINITIPSNGGMPQVGTIAAPAGDEMPDQAIMIPPLQQQIELLKQQGGRESEVINQIVNQDPDDATQFTPSVPNSEVGRTDGISAMQDNEAADRVLDLIKRYKQRLDQT